MYYFLLTCLFLSFNFFCEALQVSHLSFLENLKLGEKKQLKITLFNEKDVPERVELKLSDYWCNCEGQHFFEDIGKQTRTNAPWITLQTYRETLDPGQHVNVYFTVSVPEDPTLKGSYWSVLLIEPADPVQTIKSQMSENEMNLNIKLRFACHIVTNIGQGSPKIKILQKFIKVMNDKTYLCIDVANRGEVFLNPTMTLKLYDEQGKLENTLQGSAERLYPGSTQRYFLNSEGIPEKKFNAFLVLDNGDNSLFCDSFSLYFK